MKRLSLFFLSALLLLALSSCGEAPGGSAATADMDDLQKTMLAADPTLVENITSITGSVDNAAHLFSYLSDLPYDKVENFLLSYSTKGAADEVAVIAVKNPEDVGEAANSLRRHVDQRKQLFQQYGPAEAARVEKAEIFTKDQYAVLLICDNSPAVKTAFENFLPAAE